MISHDSIPDDFVIAMPQLLFGRLDTSTLDLPERASARPGQARTFQSSLLARIQLAGTS